jgi:RNA polymerase sigma factor (sigma-70 family)
VARFSLTRWTLIRLAQEGDEEALSAFVLRYRPPVVHYFHRRGQAEEAEDLAQEVFLRFLGEGVLARADPAQGRFRNLVFAVTRNVLGDHLRRVQAQKRGGGQVASLGSHDVEVAASEEEQEAFDRGWLTHLLERALERLEAEEPVYYAALRGVFFDQRSYEDVANELGKAKGDVNNYVYRGKKKLVSFLRSGVWEYSSSAQECREELAHLTRYLGAKL